MLDPFNRFLARVCDPSASSKVFIKQQRDSFFTRDCHHASKRTVRQTLNTTVICKHAPCVQNSQFPMAGHQPFYCTKNLKRTKFLKCTCPSRQRNGEVIPPSRGSSLNSHQDSVSHLCTFQVHDRLVLIRGKELAQQVFLRLSKARDKERGGRKSVRLYKCVARVRRAESDDAHIDRSIPLGFGCRVFLAVLSPPLEYTQLGAGTCC